MLEKAVFPMASDRTGALARQFGVYDELSGNALRGAFIINPEAPCSTRKSTFTTSEEMSKSS